MSGRVSIKGQGADIFFGQEPAEPREPERPAETPEDAGADVASLSLPEGKPASKTSGQTSSQHDGQQASQQARLQASAAPELAGSLSASTKHRLRDLLEREHRTHNTYRYHDDELAAVRDIVYELEVRRGLKVTRNDVMRAALLWTIEDYTTRGEESYLLQLLKEGD